MAEPGREDKHTRHQQKVEELLRQNVSAAMDELFQREELEDLPADVLDAYTLACKEGSRPSRTTRLMLVGHYGAGKTSLKRCLLNETFIQEYKITNGIDVDQSGCRVDITHSANWKNIEGDTKEDTSYKEEVVKAVSQLLYPNQGETTGKTISGGKTSFRSEGSQSSVRKLGDPSLALPDEDLFQQLEQLTKSKLVIQNEIQEDQFSIWDFAGQSTFYTTHQVFLTHRGIYLVVLNIMEALDSSINTDQLGFKETAQNGISSQAIIDGVLVNCIYSHTASLRANSKTAESIIIVCTHRDQLEEKYPHTASQKIRDYRRTIYKHISGKVYFDHIHLDVFTIANNAKDDPEIDRLRKTIIDLARSQPYWGEEIPLKWLALRDQLREKKKGMHSYVVTLWDIWRMCQDPKVRIFSKTQMCNILKFYHGMGEIVFFDENNLRMHVILDPQWLIDAISKVITIPMFYKSSEATHSAEMWHVLEDHGLLTQSILDSVWEERVRNHLTILMFKFRLMLPMRVCNMTHVHKKMVNLGINEHEAFLVPCLLPLQGTGRMKPCHLLPIPTVLVIFRDGFIPVGITSHLISALVMNEAWMLTGKVFQNHATFLPEGRDTNLTITIHQQDDCLHLQGHILDDKPTRPNCLRPYLFVLLEQLGFVIRSSCPKATFELAVKCECSVQPACVLKIGATGEGVEGNSSIYCNHHQITFSTESYTYWFKIDCPKKRFNTTPDQENLNDKTLLKVAHRLGTEWQGLGYRLVDSQIVDDLCTPLQGPVSIMLVRWHQSQNSAALSSMKDRLMQVLEGQRRADLVQIIREYDGPNEQHLFHKVSRGLTKIWRKVGGKLGVSASDMDIIETPQIPDYNPGLRMLVIWRDQNGCRDELIRQLKDLKHHAIACLLELREI